MTPYEKNLDVWRQLWRVTEKSDILLQVRGLGVLLLCVMRMVMGAACVLVPIAKGRCDHAAAIAFINLSLLCCPVSLL